MFNIVSLQKAAKQNKIDVIRKHDIVSSIYTALNTATEKLNMFKLDKK